jgi:hypothetical protein
MVLHNIAIRLDRKDDNSLPELQKYLDTVSESYVVSEEVSKKSKKVHYHAVVQVESHNKTKTETRKIRDNIALINPANSCYYAESVKHLEKTLCYTVKDLNVKINKWKDVSQFDDCVVETQRINDEKTQPMKQQLVKHIFEKGINDWQQIMVEIDNYHITREYLPPSPTLSYQYTLFVMGTLKMDLKLLYMEYRRIIFN